MNMARKSAALLLLVMLVGGCGENATNTDVEVLTQGEAMGETPRAPTMIKDAQGETILVLMHGWRSYDDPCRTVGETAATADYLDHTTRLIACPVGDAGIEDMTQHMQGKLLTVLEGYQLMSIPNPSTL
ncbi:hypothetical protein GCM10007938_33580 [Vibrio zhanjiangensis]|uniref:Alpha/beta hydrolase n=2 Tax=Vibrio zhanjiangensis TaxID=1046128 RepID=A0ABQ6F409_9VIBR|nr:hypothetical protein GCM10007938_33580 [Vibrio zhanjiangensis]